ncbi:Lysyl endopeptidase [bacterium HR16]|nr:Lysyl endopeptidase [bacterium HR16]
MRLHWLIVPAIVLSSGAFARAQVNDPYYEPAFVDGAQRPADSRVREQVAPRLIAPKLEATRIPLPATVVLPGEPDEEDHAKPKMRIGYTIDAPPDLLSNARWHRLSFSTAGDTEAPVSEGRICHLELYSPGAVGLRLQMQGKLPDGAVMYIYEPNGSVVLGPVKAKPDEYGRWWAPTLWGRGIGIELLVPSKRALREIPQIVAIACLYAGVEPATPPGALGPTVLGCHLDVTCYSSWASEARSVARMLFPEGGGWFVCTGELLNRTGTDFAPIFMSANHCISTQASAHGLEAYWFYQTDTCNGTPPSLNTVPRTDGALLLKHHTGADWVILGLYERPAGDYYLGWNSGSWGSGDSATTIHHPGGSYKRITFSTSNGTLTGCGFDLWDTDISVGNGTIEGGSSGSAVMDSARRVRGPASCAQFDGYDSNGNPIWRCPPLWAGYGRMDVAFGTIRWYIWEMANPTYADRSVGGDPGNEGSSERGTSANPFNTVYEATFCVPTNGTVRIRPGSYNERFVVWRAMRLERDGTSGIVRIGAP